MVPPKSGILFTLVRQRVKCALLNRFLEEEARGDEVPGQTGNEGFTHLEGPTKLACDSVQNLHSFDIADSNSIGVFA